jgi:probable rRNA maturation factor
VLSFPHHDYLRPGELPKVSNTIANDLGDIVFGMPYIDRYCKEHNIPIQDHVCRLLVHGMCHLLGYVHDTDEEEQQMNEKENYLLEKLKEMELR